MHSSIYQINRRHTVNASYFDQIDTPEKAYWLGFLWADGNISRTAPRCSGPNRLRLSQKVPEKGHIQLFLDTIEADYEIDTLTNGEGRTTCQVDINSRPLCMALEALGYGLKADRTTIPPMPAELLHHFVRGYFDGDGCLSIYQQRYKHYVIERQEWSITGPPDLIQAIRSLLEEETSVSKKVRTKTYKRTTKAVSLRYGRRSDVEALHEYLYKDATVFLHSKHDKFVEHFLRGKQGC